MPSGSVPLCGNIFDAYWAAILLILANLSMGLLVSACTLSQFLAMQMTFFVFLPSILLPGFMFPFDDMPRAVQWIDELLSLPTSCA